MTTRRDAQGVQVTFHDDGTIDLSWDPVPGAVSYTLIPAYPPDLPRVIAVLEEPC